MKNQVVFGAGLIGCYLGGVMAGKGLNVTLVGRKKMARQLAQGISLTDYQGHSMQVDQLNLVDVDTLDKASAATTPADVIWLTVKCHDVATAAFQLSPLVGPQTLILCCQNGLGSDSEVRQQFPDNPVLRVMVPFNVVNESGNHYHRGSQGDMVIESNPALHPRIEELVSIIRDPMLPVTVTDNMQAVLWAKLQLNLGNAVNALADIPVKTMLEQRGYRQLMAGMMRELLHITRRLNVKLPRVTSVPASLLPLILSLPDWLFKRVANAMLEIDPKVRTSMWWDLNSGKPTEIGHLNGVVVETGRELGIDTPVNQAIVTLIRQAEADNTAGRARRHWSAPSLRQRVGEAVDQVSTQA